MCFSYLLFVVSLSPLTGGLFTYVPYVITLTTYNVYSAYRRALTNGRRNIRFVSLQPRNIVGNPVTSDTGMGAVDSQSGDF